MEEKINVFIIHNGNQPYLKLMLAQLESIGEENVNIILLGKGASELKYGEEITKYFSLANDFKKYYFHLSQQTQAFELLCIQRWMVIYEYMKKNNLNGRILHLDSDVMMFIDPNKLFEIYQPFDVTMGLNWSPANTMFRDREVLESFCDFIFDLYKNNKETLEQVYQKECIEKRSPNGISDMRLFQLWIKSSKVNYVDTGLIRRYQGKEYICDVNFNMSNGFEVKDKYKKVYRIGNGLYFNNPVNNKKIRVCCLHFQGAAKKEMHKYKDNTVVLPEGYQNWHIKFFLKKNLSEGLEKIRIKSKIKNIVNKFR